MLKSGLEPLICNVTNPWVILQSCSPKQPHTINLNSDDRVATWTWNRHPMWARYLMPLLSHLGMVSWSHLRWELLFLLLLICLQTRTKHPVTGPQFVSLCLRSEPEHARQYWATGAKGLGSGEAERPGPGGAAGARGGVFKSGDLWWKYQVQRLRWEEEEQTSPSSLISVIPLPARSQGSHTTSTLGTK